LFELTSVAIGFHPATHWLKRRLDESREIACDEAVSGRYVDSASYARTLIEIAGQATSETRLRPAVAVSNGTFLEARIMRLLSDWKGKKSRSGMILGLAALGVVASIASNLAVTVRASGRSAPLEATSAALELSDSEAAQLAEPEVYQRRGQRDPFLAPTVEIQPRRVEGIGGLDVESLELRGIVETTNGFRAMVTGPDQRTYFLRGGERFFNGRLVRIAKDALAFRVRERDPLRTGVERDVVVRLHAVEEN
jgi:Tfp pilus assembly protein PilP